MKSILNTLRIILFLSIFPVAYGHDLSADATYLGNEGVMIDTGKTKILFDPFFHNDYKIYQLVPEDIREAMFKGTAPYDKINAIFISHAHQDHFSATDALKFLKAHSTTQLVAPKQAIDLLVQLPEADKVMSRVKPVSLNFGDQPVEFQFKDILVEAVRIPHAGWPGRANISNMVYRVTLNDSVTVMHMGDADPDDSHYSPFQAHWKKRVTNVAFPPYWFFLSDKGNKILQSRLNALEHVGVHVPVIIPGQLRASGADYFSKPGEKRAVSHSHK